MSDNLTELAVRELRAHLNALAKTARLIDEYRALMDAGERLTDPRLRVWVNSETNHLVPMSRTVEGMEQPKLTPDEVNFPAEVSEAKRCPLSFPNLNATTLAFFKVMGVYYAHGSLAGLEQAFEKRTGYTLAEATERLTNFSRTCQTWLEERGEVREDAAPKTRQKTVDTTLD